MNSYSLASIIIIVGFVAAAVVMVVQKQSVEKNRSSDIKIQETIVRIPFFEGFKFGFAFALGITIFALVCTLLSVILFWGSVYAFLTGLVIGMGPI